MHGMTGKGMPLTVRLVLILQINHLLNLSLVHIPPQLDTNGAGDAFVGGFLAQLVAAPNPSLEQMCLAGHKAAHVVVQHRGCSYPEKPTFQLAR